MAKRKPKAPKKPPAKEPAAGKPPDALGAMAEAGVLDEFLDELLAHAKKEAAVGKRKGKKAQRRG